MKKILMAFVLVVLSLSILTGCGGTTSETPTSAPTSEPTSNVTVTDEPDVSLSEVTISVLNSTGYTFFDLYISPSYEDWGGSLLGSDEVEYGSTYSVTIPESSTTYDIKAVDSEGDSYVVLNLTLEDECQVDISLESAEVGALITYSDGSTSYVEGSLEVAENDEDSESGPSLTFYNETPWPFSEIFVYEASQPDMGSNLIEDSIFDSGASIDLKVENNYSGYDIELTDENGDSWEFSNIQLEDGCEVHVAAEDAPILRVVSAGGATEEYVGDIT